MLKYQNKFQGKPEVRIHIMAKATGAICNLNCSYCYYLSKESLLTTTSKWRMSDEVLEEYIKQYIEAQNTPKIIFSWQGGEPTLLGVDFFKKVVELQKKYTPSYSHCENDLQTNGTLLDDEWCVFLKENNFLVGLSIDGPQEIHDTYRVTKEGKGTFKQVMHAASLLKKHKVPFATLSCINATTAKHPQKIYRFLRDEVGSTQMQFIPIVEPKKFRDTAPQFWSDDNMPLQGSDAARPGTPSSVVEEWCVDPEEYGDFLIGVFDQWRKKDVGRIHIPFFDSAAQQWLGGSSPLCIFSPTCGKGLAIEHDGNVYSCDHYVYPQYNLGNITQYNLKDLAFSQNQVTFGTDKANTLPTQCQKCPVLFACEGECPKNRFIKTPQGERGLNYLCTGLKKYFFHIDPHIKKILRTQGLRPKVNIRLPQREI